MIRTKKLTLVTLEFFRKSASWTGKKKFSNEDSSPQFAPQAFRASYPRPTSGRSSEGGRSSGGGQAIDIPHKNRSCVYQVFFRSNTVHTAHVLGIFSALLSPNLKLGFEKNLLFRAMYTGNANDSTVMVDTSESWAKATELSGASTANAARAAKNRAAVRSNYGARNGHKSRRMYPKTQR